MRRAALRHKGLRRSLLMIPCVAGLVAAFVVTPSPAAQKTAPSQQPSLWALSVSADKVPSAQVAKLQSLRRRGIQALVVNAAALSPSAVAKLTDTAAHAGMIVIAARGSLRPGACPGSTSTLRTCAVIAQTPSEAVRLARTDSFDFVVFYVSNLRQIGYLRGVTPVHTQLLAIVQPRLVHANARKWMSAARSASGDSVLNLTISTAPTATAPTMSLLSLVRGWRYKPPRPRGPVVTTTTPLVTTAAATPPPTTTTPPPTTTTPPPTTTTPPPTTTTPPPTTTTPPPTTTTGDTQPPSAPGGLSVTSATQTSVALKWNASSDNVGVSGYDLIRDGSSVGTTSATTRTFASLTCGTSYTLGVDAFDAAGNKSTVTSITASTAACPDTQAPTTPMGLLVTGSTTTSVSISWSPSFDNVSVAGYDAYLGSTLAGTTTSFTIYTFAGLTCGTSYTVSVDAYDPSGNKSGKASVTTSTAPCSVSLASVTFNSPAAGSTVSGSVVWAVQPTVAFAHVDFIIDGGAVGWTEQSCPCYYNGDPNGRLDTTALANGGHTLTAKAYNSSGTEVAESSESVTVNNAAPPPPTTTTPTPPPPGGANWAGTFNCYGPSTTGCWTPNTCTVTAAAGSLSDLQAKMNAATDGAVICGSGTYSGQVTVNTNHSTRVIVQSTDPNSPMSLAGVVSFSHSGWTFQGIHFTGDLDIERSSNFTFLHNLDTGGQMKLCAGGSAPCANGDTGPPTTNANILVDHSEFTNYNETNGGAEGRIQVVGTAGFDGPSYYFGMTFQYNWIHGGYPNSCSDGISGQASTNGLVIRYNEFSDMQQGDCVTEFPVQVPHVDPLADWDAYGSIITGNYFHDMGDGSGGIADFSSCDHQVITNNVFVGSVYARGIACGINGSTTANGETVTHNTLVDRTISMGHTSGSTGNVVQNNVSGGSLPGEMFATENHNLCWTDVGETAQCTGAGDIKTSEGSVQFQTTPATGYYHYELAPGQPGYNAGSDGKSMGICSTCGS
jgi:chitodextrinase